MRLIDLKSRYSDKYPDVIKTKAAIKELEAQLAAPGKEASATKPDNPAYITMTSQLAGTRTEIESVQRQIKDLRKKRDAYRQRVESAPRVEEGYRGMLVDRNNLQAKFEELNRKSMDAQVAYGMEKEQLGEKFSIIDAARLPEKPDSPNIPAILLIGLVLGLGSGVGAAAAEGKHRRHGARRREAGRGHRVPGARRHPGDRDAGGRRAEEAAARPGGGRRRGRPGGGGPRRALLRDGPGRGVGQADAEAACDDRTEGPDRGLLGRPPAVPCRGSCGATGWK